MPVGDFAHFEVDSSTHGEESEKAKVAPGSAKALARISKRMIDKSDVRLGTCSIVSEPFQAPSYQVEHTSPPGP